MPSILMITSRVLGPFILQALVEQLLSPGTVPSVKIDRQISIIPAIKHGQ